MLNSRIKNKEQEIGVEQATSTKLNETPELNIVSDDKDNLTHHYTILGRVLRTNKVINEPELNRIVGVIKETIQDGK